MIGHSSKPAQSGSSLKVPLPGMSCSKQLVAHRVGTEVMHNGKWIKLQMIKYVDDAGQSKTWESYERTTKLHDNEADAAVIIAVMKGAGKAPQLLLVKQFRAAVNAYTIEFPAGLIDAGETPEVTAKRELKEETGYVGDIVSVSPLLPQSVLGRETCRLVRMKINLDKPENQNPTQCVEDRGLIEHLTVPYTNLLAHIESLRDKNCLIYEDVYSFALGLHLSPSDVLSPLSLK